MIILHRPYTRLDTLSLLSTLGYTDSVPTAAGRPHVLSSMNELFFLLCQLRLALIKRERFGILFSHTYM